MTDAECPSFLQWALPRLGRRWAGYRMVRGLAARRIARRLRPPGIEDLAGYRVRQAFPTLTLGIVATDCDPVLIERARAGCYRESSLKELPVDGLSRMSHRGSGAQIASKRGSPCSASNAGVTRRNGREVDRSLTAAASASSACSWRPAATALRASDQPGTRCCRASRASAS